MPMLGLGVYDMYAKEAVQAVLWALEIGYRLIDTASFYQNEAEIGEAIRSSEVAREEIFLTTKLWNSDQGYDQTLIAFDKSLKKLNSDYIDLYLIHWPVKKYRKESWKALEYLYETKRVRSIGVSNYLLPFLKELEGYREIVPAVNQIEFSPYLFRKDELAYCLAQGIQLQAYTPLARGKKFSDPKLLHFSNKYDKTPAQIMLRFIVESGVSAIPKSVTYSRLKENFDIFDFELDPMDWEEIANFHESLRVCDDPMTMY